MEEQLIIEVWDTFKDYIPEKSKDVAAGQYIDYLLGKDVELSVLEGLLGYDSHLDDAIQMVVDEAGIEDDSDVDDYDDDYIDED